MMMNSKHKDVQYVFNNNLKKNNMNNNNNNNKNNNLIKLKNL